MVHKYQIDSNDRTQRQRNGLFWSSRSHHRQITLHSVVCTTVLSMPESVGYFFHIALWSEFAAHNRGSEDRVYLAKWIYMAILIGELLINHGFSLGVCYFQRNPYEPPSKGIVSGRNLPWFTVVCMNGVNRNVQKAEIRHDLSIHPTRQNFNTHWI